MSLRTQYEFLFVGRDEGSFVENYAYDLGEGGENSGKIFINLEIQNNLAQAETIGEVIFDTVRKGFYADLEKDPYGRFEDALKEVNKALNTMKKESPSNYLGVLNVLIAAVVGNNLFLTQCGDAEAYLVRRRFCSTVSEGLSDPNSQDYFSNIASGTLEVGDFILLSSTRLLRYLTKNDLGKIASSRNLIASLGELKDFLSTEVLSRIGFVGMAAMERAPQLSNQEKGQVIAHLRKEEEFAEAGVDRRKSINVMVSDFGKQMKSLYSDLKNRVNFDRLPERGRVLKGRASNGMQNLFLSNWSKDKIMGALIAVILIFTVGIWWLRGNAEEQDKISKYNAILNSVQETIASAETTGQYDKEKAGQMLNDAEQKAVGVLNSGYNRSRSTELLTSIKQERDKLDGVTRVTPKVLADLSVKRQNVSALGLLNLKGNLFAYEYNALYPLLLDKVQDPLTIDDNDSVISASAFDDKDSLVFFTKDGRVLEYKDKRISAVTSIEGAYHKGTAIQMYGNKLYILDSANNQIWRYPRKRDQFDTAEQYNVDADLKNGVAFAIDSDVYVLNNDGTMVKLSRGNKQNFQIKKQPINPLTNPAKILTGVDMNQIFVLEPSTHRVMVFYKDENSKNLIYSQQYLFSDLDKVVDFQVDITSKKIYLLDATKVYQFDMQ